MADRWHVQTRPLVEEALRRNIVVTPIPELDDAHAMLEYEGHREFIATTATDRHGLVTSRIGRHKGAVLALLARLDYPVAPTIFTAKIEAARAFLRLHGRVVIKPADCSLGIGVTTDIAAEDELENAIAEARVHTSLRSGRVIVQAHLSGHDQRVLVVDGREVFGVVRLPPFVLGDGQRTVAELVEIWNADLEHERRRIRMDERARAHLAGQGVAPDTIVADGTRVELRSVASVSRGGFCCDTTDEMGEPTRALARRIAHELDLPVLGIDFITTDIRSQPGRIIEVNVGPGITIHESPTVGQPRPVAAAIIDMLFPETR